MGRNFVGVFRGSSAARFVRGEHVRVLTGTPIGPVQLTYRTRYSDEGFQDEVPREMWVEARGEAQCALDEAIDAYQGAASAFVPVFSVSANAPASDLDVVLGYDATPGAEHEFFQRLLPDITDIRHGRDVNAAGTAELFQALERHANDDRERLVRACVQYREALEHWKPGRETFAVAHLWMAVEALTKVALRKALQDAGCPGGDELASLWNVDKSGLDGEVRLRLIFHGDRKCKKTTSDASNGFEHSYMPLNEVHRLASNVQERSADHVRRAIIELVGVPEDQRRVLLGAPFNSVNGSWPLIRYVRGKFMGPEDRLAPTGEAYPRLIWKGALDAYRRTPDGEEVSFSDQIESRSGDGVEFVPEVFEVWGPKNDATTSGHDFDP